MQATMGMHLNTNCQQLVGVGGNLKSGATQFTGSLRKGKKGGGGKKEKKNPVHLLVPVNHEMVTKKSVKKKGWPATNKVSRKDKILRKGARGASWLEQKGKN